MYGNSPLFGLSSLAFYELSSYGDVWWCIGSSLSIFPCIQSMMMALDQACLPDLTVFGDCLGCYYYLYLVIVSFSHLLLFVYGLEIILNCMVVMFPRKVMD